MNQETPPTMNDQQDSQPENNATDMFVHGLLQIHSQRPLEREQRMNRLMQSIPAERAQFSRGWMKWARQSAALLATAAVIALMFIITPRQVEASAQAKAVVEAEKKTRDRRVLFQLIPPVDRPDGPSLFGSLDIRDDKHLVLTLRKPDGSFEVRGRDGDHYWMIDRAGKLRDLPSDMPWPTWIESPRGGLLVDMAEAVEQGVNDEWTWSRENSTLRGDRLIATRKVNKPAEPNKIDLRVHASTGLASQIELWWPENNSPPRGPGAGPGRMNGDGPKDGPLGGRMNGDGPMRGPDGAMNERRPPRGHDGDGPLGGRMNGDGPPPQSPMQSVPMGPPSKMTLIMEPPITFQASWFTPETQLKLNAK